MNAIEEYKDITTHLRNRHNTIWHTRNIYTLIMLAIVGLTYQLKFTGLSLRLSVAALALAAVAMTVVICIIECRYAKMKTQLTSRAIELEKDLGFSQYSRLEKLREDHPSIFRYHPQIIYSLLFLAYVGAILTRMFI